MFVSTQGLPFQSCTALCLLTHDIIVGNACFPSKSGQPLGCNRSSPRFEAAPSIDCTLAAFPKLAALPTVDIEAPPACRAFSSLSRISQMSLTKNRKKSCASWTRREMAEDWQGEGQMAGCKLLLNRHRTIQACCAMQASFLHVLGRSQFTNAAGVLRRQTNVGLADLLACLQSHSTADAVYSSPPVQHTCGNRPHAP